MKGFIPDINHAINPIMEVAKLRAITTSFKRHSIKRAIRPTNLDPKRILYSQQGKLRQSVADYFFQYCRQVLPKIEEKIELQLLEKFTDSIGNSAEKKEVFNAYYQRKDNLAKMAEVMEIGEREERPEQLIIKNDDIARTIMSVEGDGLTYHTFEDIGRYTVFPLNHWKRMFPTKMFGNYENDDYKFNQTFGIMAREEGLRITNDLARLTLPHERKLDYIQLLGYENSQVKEEIIKDEERFIGVQQDFSLDLLDYINSQPQEYHQQLKKLFQSPAVFDGLVSILVQELRKKPIRYHLCIKEARMKVIDRIVRQMNQVMIDKKLNPQKLGEIIENLPMFVIDLEKKDLGEHSDLQKNEIHQYKLYASGYHKICYHLWRPEDIRRVSLPRFKGNNSGLLLWGPRGCGKSQILSYVTAWAHENKWMVVAIPRCEHFSDGTQETFRYKNGLYLQHTLARQLLHDLKTSNEYLMRTVDVDMSVYGKIDISGMKDGDPEPCPKVWDAERQVWSDSWKEHLYDFEIKQLQQKYEEMNFRCADQLPNPKKLIEIIDLGIANSEIATSCFGEILEQLYNSDKFHVLFAMDGFNDWMKPTNYLSFRYENSRKSKGYIPPQDFALIRMLMKFDGHFMRNGVKLMATTHLRQYKHLCTPEMINFPDGYNAKVENMSLNDFRNMLTYYNITDWTADYYKEWQIESWYMETQGNCDLSPSSKNALDQKLKLFYDIISRKKGSLTQEDDDLVFLKSIFREIPVFKDIPNNFKLELSNSLEALAFSNNDLIFDMSEKQHIYIMLQGEAMIVSSEKSLQTLQNLKPSASNTNINASNDNEAILGTTFEQEVQLNQIRTKRQTIVGIREAPQIMTRNISQDQSSPLNKLTSTNQNIEEERQAQFESFKKSDEVKMIQSCDCFGQYYSLTGSKWRPSFVIASSDKTLVIRTLVSKVDNILNKINSSEQHKQLLNFLGLTISGFDRISAVARDKIARSFVEKQYFPGQKLQREGDCHNSAFIIKEGDCSLVSKTNPCDIKFNEEGTLIVKEKNQMGSIANDKRKRGYMSKTTNQFQFGIKGKYQWVGEDILILANNEPLYYSVIAVGKVTVIEISKVDMQSKLPSQFLKFLEKSSLKRKEWLKDRMMNINKTIKQVIKQSEEKEIFDNEDERKMYKHQKSLFIQQQIRMLSNTEAQDKKTFKKMQKKNTIYMKIKDDFSVEQEQLKQQQEKEITLPMINNPRDKQMQINLTHASSNGANDQQQSQFLSQINLKSMPNDNSPSKGQGNDVQQFQTPGQIQSIIMQKLNMQIQQKNVQKYREEASRTQGAKSELGHIRQSGNNPFSEYNLTQDGRNQQSYANLSLVDQSEMGDQSSLINVSQNDIMHTADSKGVRKGLLNATTLKPYEKLNIKRRELVPIFYQRNPKKTRNMIANSMHAIKLVNDHQEQLTQKRGSVNEIEYDERSQYTQSIQGTYQRGGQRLINPSTSYNEHKSYISDSEYIYQSQAAIQPYIYEFSINNGNSVSQHPTNKSTTTKSILKLTNQLKKEAKEKYGSFMLGNFKINELDKNAVNLKAKSYLNGVANNSQYNDDYSTEVNDAADSRKGTPNPWEIYRKRQARKVKMGNGTQYKEEMSDHAKSSLSYLNYDI